MKNLTPNALPEGATEVYEIKADDPRRAMFAGHALEGLLASKSTITLVEGQPLPQHQAAVILADALMITLKMTANDPLYIPALMEYAGITVVTLPEKEQDIN